MKKSMQLLAVIFVLTVFADQTPCVEVSRREPLAMIRSGTDQIVALLKASVEDESSKPARLGMDMVDLISEYVDFEEMSSRSLGHYWKQQTPEKRLRFVGLFRALFCGIYLNNLKGSDVCAMEIVFDEEKVQDKYALVMTHVKTSNHPPVSVQYRMMLKDECWKIYDVVVEGVSFVNNYRSQFSSLLDTEPFDSILQQLEQKVSA